MHCYLQADCTTYIVFIQINSPSLRNVEKSDHMPHEITLGL